MQTIRQHFTLACSYPVIFTRNAFGPGSPLMELLGAGPAPVRVLAVVDSGVLECWPGFRALLLKFTRGCAGKVLMVHPSLVIPGGEACKNDPSFVEAIRFAASRHRLCRHSFILAIGGGAVLDAAGFAAATAHRGIRLIRMPTTTLSMNDAGVGVKNGINAFGRKNFTGCFASPFAVVNDYEFLRRLPERELRCGIAEAVKVALIRDRDFFDWLYAARYDLARFDSEAMEQMIFRCAELHLGQIANGGDPFERGSSRPLDFGHWSAHRLEELTGGSMRHGEAVAIGVALDVLYSRRCGLLGDADVERTFSILETVGFRLYHGALEGMDVSLALAGFREHLGGELSVTLVERVGVGGEQGRLDPELYLSCIRALEARQRVREVADAGIEVPLDGSGRPGPLLS